MSSTLPTVEVSEIGIDEVSSDAPKHFSILDEILGNSSVETMVEQEEAQVDEGVESVDCTDVDASAEPIPQQSRTTPDEIALKNRLLALKNAVLSKRAKKLNIIEPQSVCQPIVHIPEEPVAIAEIIEPIVELPHVDVIIEEQLQNSNSDTIVIEKESDGDQLNEINLTSRFVRIDNLQRPLNLRMLISWLQGICGHDISSKSVWLNGIKSHCYVDFDTAQQAATCVAGVTGKVFPPTNTLSLTADHTQVSALLAASHPEASLKVGQWKSASSSNSHISKNGHGAVSAAAVVVGGRADASNTASSETGSATGSPRSQSLQATSSSNMFSKAVAMATSGGRAGSTGTAPGHSHDQSQSTVLGSVETGGFSTRKHRLETGQATLGDLEAIAVDKRTRIERNRNGSSKPAMGKQIEIDANDDDEGVSLDNLFRKTIALPRLYWLPQSEEIVLARKQLVQSRQPTN